VDDCKELNSESQKTDGDYQHQHDDLTRRHHHDLGGHGQTETGRKSSQLSINAAEVGHSSSTGVCLLS